MAYDDNMVNCPDCDGPAPKAADRRPHVDRAALLELATRWETRAERLGYHGTPLAVAAQDLRRLLDAPRGPGGGERLTDAEAVAVVNAGRARVAQSVARDQGDACAPVLLIEQPAARDNGVYCAAHGGRLDECDGPSAQPAPPVKSVRPTGGMGEGSTVDNLAAWVGQPARDLAAAWDKHVETCQGGATRSGWWAMAPRRRALLVGWMAQQLPDLPMACVDAAEVGADARALLANEAPRWRAQPEHKRRAYVSWLEAQRPTVDGEELSPGLVGAACDLLRGSTPGGDVPSGPGGEPAPHGGGAGQGVDAVPDERSGPERRIEASRDALVDLGIGPTRALRCAEIAEEEGAADPELWHRALVVLVRDVGPDGFSALVTPSAVEAFRFMLRDAVRAAVKPPHNATRSALGETPAREQTPIAAPDREALGRAVHGVWKAAYESRTGSSLRTWEERTDEQRERDRLVGERLFAMGVQHARAAARLMPIARGPLADLALRMGSVIAETVGTPFAEAIGVQLAIKLLGIVDEHLTGSDRVLGTSPTAAQDGQSEIQAEPTGPRIEVRDGVEVTVDSPDAPGSCTRRAPDEPWLRCTIHIDGQHVAEGTRLDTGVYRVAARWPIAPAEG